MHHWHADHIVRCFGREGGLRTRGLHLLDAGVASEELERGEGGTTTVLHYLDTDRLDKEGSCRGTGEIPGGGLLQD